MLNGWVNNIFNTNNEKTYRNHVNVLNKHAIDIKKPSVLNQGKTLHNKQATQLESLKANLLGFNEDIATPYTNTSPYAYTNTFAKYNTANTYANGETYSNAHTYATTNTYAKGNREGFNTIAISKANEKNSKELQEQNNLSANYADKINRYNTEYPSLLTDTRMYSKGTDRTKNFKENTDELKEVDFMDVSALESITLKKPNQVYYEIYKAAIKKAKMAKKEAIIAFLEAKNIKKTYMLENLDESDSDTDMDLDNLSEYSDTELESER